MALTVSEGEAMVHAARASQHILSIGLVRRFLPAARTIRDLLSQNILGDVVSFSCDEGRVFDWPVQSAAYFQQNGVLLDIGVHVLDLLYWWWGEPEEILYEDDAMGGVEANCRVRLRFPHGFEGQVRLSRDNQLRNMAMIRFEKGWINWELDETDRVQMGLWDSSYSLNAAIHGNVGYGKNNAAPDLVFQDFQQCFASQIGNVVSAVRGHEALYIPAEEGLPSLRMIEQCYSQRSLMEMPWLSEREAARARQLSWRGPG
jgi:predicted dehydrogenase